LSARRKGRTGQGRTLAEWITFAISLGIVLLVIAGVVATMITAGDRPPAITVQPRLEQVRAEAGRFYLPLVVRNEGGRSVEEVRIVVTHGSGSDSSEAEVVIDLLAAGETADATVSFSRDPRQGSLSAEVRSFRQP
jgi:uncharacterized protein (TIGR02588 family)